MHESITYKETHPKDTCYFFKITNLDTGQQFIDNETGKSVADAWGKIQESYRAFNYGDYVSLTASLMTGKELEDYLNHYDKSEWLESHKFFERIGDQS